MSGFIKFIGTLSISVWLGLIFFGEDFKRFFPDESHSYFEDLMNNKWLLLVVGIILSILGAITKIKQHRENNKRDQSVSDLTNQPRFETPNSNLVKKDFIAEQYRHRAEQFTRKQQGHLKELAMKVDWTPLKGGGANFKTSSLKRISSSRLETAKSKGGFAFGGVFAIVGLGIMFGMSYSFYKENGLSLELLFPILFGTAFVGVGISMLIWPRSRIFDLRQGWFWAGSKSLHREQEFTGLKQSARLSDIAVIQVIAERISGSKGGSYTSWEINLVSKDGERLNVMDHGNKLSIIDDAQFIGKFLGVPVWDNT